MHSSPLPDQFGTPLKHGDRVARTQIAKGSPMWATTGTVVGLGRTNIVVEWSGYAYSDAEEGHRTSPSNVRRVPTCTCGAQDYPSCLCELSPAQWTAAHPNRPIA